MHLTAISKSRLKASLNRAADIGPLSEQLVQLFRGTKIRANKIGDLTAQVTAAQDPLKPDVSLYTRASRLMDDARAIEAIVFVGAVLWTSHFAMFRVSAPKAVIDQGIRQLDG